MAAKLTFKNGGGGQKISFVSLQPMYAPRGGGSKNVNVQQGSRGYTNI